jgi:transposase
VLGVDDWALRRGQKYGTILVDLERHQPVDLLLDRTAETLATWLRAHPGVELISRDRSPEYSRGASEGAPQAHQVADRWHLLKNLREALERLLSRLRTELEHLPLPANAPPPTAVPRPALDSQKPSRQVALQANRERRYARYQAVRALLEQGVPQLQIAHQLGMARRTVRTFAQADTFPERALPPPVKSILDPYLPYLHRRLVEGCSNSSQLWRELQTQGYGGSRAQVASWVQSYRTHPSPSTPQRYLADPSPKPLKAAPLPSLLPAPRQLVWYLLRSTDDLTPEEKRVFAQIRLHPQVDSAYRLSRQFQRMVRDHCADNLSAWLQACLDSAIPDLRTFAASLQREEPSIRLALSTAWSNGPVEGFVNRLKLIKRSMYGRANFDLLRLRVLAPSP